jgi:predicted naringenin-chalcone synthase
MMNNPKILALQTGVPKNCYLQDDITDFYIQHLKMQGKPRERAIRAIMNYAGIQSRYSVVEADFFSQSKTTQERNELYMAEALPLAEAVIQAGLAQLELSPQDIDSLTVVSCTGFNIPGLDLLLARQLGMASNLRRACIFGMGCYGAFPGIKHAMETVQAGSNRLAIMLALELCTVHLQFDDSAQSVVSSSLFADGAGMVIIGGTESKLEGPKIVDTETYCDYQTLDEMSFTVTDNGFRMYLSSYVPDILAANISEFVERLLERNQLESKDVKFWSIHPGSKRIIEYIQEELGLSTEQVRCSLEILSHYGNMSSATVLFVLNSILEEGLVQRGDYIVMMAFGPGLTMEAILLQV